VGRGGRAPGWLDHRAQAKRTEDVIADAHEQDHTLTDAWAERQFVVCFRSRDALSAAARLLSEHLSQVRDEFRAPSAPG